MNLDEEKSAVFSEDVQMDALPIPKRRSQLSEVWRRFRKNKSALIGLVVVSLLLALACSANLLFDYEKDAIEQSAALRLMKPCAEHIFGTDGYGRDVLARIVFGTRMSLLIGFAVVGLALTVGGIIGAVSGFYGGRVDNVLMRIMDMLMAIPAILLAIAIVAALGPNLMNLVIALSLSSVPGFARIIRASILSIRDQEYVEATRAIGASDFRIITRHVLPNAIGPVIVQATLSLASVILSAASLSYVGLGVQPPTPEWGTMLAGAKEYIMTQPYLIVFPGLAIVITVLAVNLLGDGLRDALDPRLK